MLRLLNLVLCLVMIVFAALQYNDPDVLLWIAYYAIPAAWAFVAAFRHRLFQSVQWLGWLWASVAAWAGLVWYYWPKVPNFWRTAVWTQEETAREGMGLMIALAVLLAALFTAYKKR